MRMSCARLSMWTSIVLLVCMVLAILMPLPLHAKVGVAVVVLWVVTAILASQVDFERTRNVNLPLPCPELPRLR